jgi:hypothetical protein
MIRFAKARDEVARQHEARCFMRRDPKGVRSSASTIFHGAAHAA